MASSDGPSFEETATLLEAFVSLSPAAQRIVLLLSQLPRKLGEEPVRAEARGFLLACLDAGVDPVGVERARAVLAAYEGVLGGHEAEGVRRVA